MILKTKLLTAGYDGAPVVKEIDITLAAGMILTLLGPNGSGKSTVLKTIAKQLTPISGAVFISDKDCGKMSGQKLARELSVVFTGSVRQEYMTCYDIAAAGRYPYTGTFGALGAVDKEKIKEAMELCAVWDLRERDFTRISDGQRQRVLLSRALCQEPKIILLDEPVSFLDIRYAYEISQIILDLAKKRGAAVVMALHQIDMASKISDIVMCVKDGLIYKTGPPKDVLTKETVCRLYDLTEEGYGFTFG